MKAEMRDANTLVVTPESTAEMIVLAALSGAVVRVEQPRPFAMNVPVLAIERPAAPPPPAPVVEAETGQ